jgi:hypothetical protein
MPIVERRARGFSAIVAPLVKLAMRRAKEKDLAALKRSLEGVG